MSKVDVCVIGGGIAGTSVASALAERGATVAVCERHGQLGTQTTGRSAAMFLEGYGTHNLRLLTKASRSWFDDGGADDDLIGGPLLRQRTMLSIGRADQRQGIDRQVAACETVGNAVSILGEDQARIMHPHLRIGYVDAAVADEASFEIDVERSLQMFYRTARRAGAEFHLTHDIWRVEGSSATWTVHATDVDGTIQAGVLVNAAGAWGDVVADMAGVEPIGLEPRRRTACTVASGDIDTTDLPLLVDIDEKFYVKPESGHFLYSPADTTPSAPMDARAEEIDVALALERVAAATTLPARSVTASWAGLRTFSPDGEIVLGPEPSRPEFVWCVGQGGTGIQTAPAAAAIVADHVAGESNSALSDQLRPERIRGVPHSSQHGSQQNADAING